MKEGSKSQNVGLKMERDEETTLNIKRTKLKFKIKHWNALVVVLCAE